MADQRKNRRYIFVDTLTRLYVNSLQSHEEENVCFYGTFSISRHRIPFPERERTVVPFMLCWASRYFHAVEPAEE